MSRTLAWLACAAVLVQGIGCASIVAHGPDFVPVSSEPPGAVVRLDGAAVGRTPMVVPIDRSSEGVLLLEREGYRTAKVDLDKVPNGWFFGNLLWLPVWPVVPIGMLVDVAAGHVGKYPGTPVHVLLEQRDAVGTGDRP
jgi:hypothetical protein